MSSRRWARHERVGGKTVSMIRIDSSASREGEMNTEINDAIALGSRARRNTISDAVRRAALRHGNRPALNFAARADGITVDQVIDHMCDPLR